MDELKPCPFCGSNKVAQSQFSLTVYCDACDAAAPVKHWNRRAEPSAVQEAAPTLATEPRCGFTDIRKDAEGYYCRCCRKRMDKYWVTLVGRDATLLRQLKEQCGEGA